MSERLRSKCPYCHQPIRWKVIRDCGHRFLVGICEKCGEVYVDFSTTEKITEEDGLLSEDEV